MKDTKKHLLNWLRTGIPITISGCILWYYLYNQDWRKIVDVAHTINLTFAFLAILIPQVIIWCADTLITKIHFTWYHKPFPWKDYFWSRGALYLMLLINTALGSISIVYYLHRKTRIRWRQLTGLLFFRGLLTTWSIALMMIPSTLLMQYWGLTEKLNVNPYVLWMVLLLACAWLVAAWLTWHHNINLFRLPNLEGEYWTAFRNSTRAQWLITFIIGGVPIFLLLTGFWVLAITFGIRIPFIEFIIAAPLMYAISELPIAFAGFGTTTMAWFLFFGDYGNDAAITSFTIFLPIARLSARAIIGTISLPLALKTTFSGNLFKKETIISRRQLIPLFRHDWKKYQ